MLREDISVTESMHALTVLCMNEQVIHYVWMDGQSCIPRCVPWRSKLVSVWQSVLNHVGDTSGKWYLSSMEFLLNQNEINKTLEGRQKADRKQTSCLLFFLKGKPSKATSLSIEMYFQNSYNHFKIWLCLAEALLFKHYFWFSSFQTIHNWVFVRV